MTDHSAWLGPATIRSRLILETVAAMTAADGEPYREAEVHLSLQNGSRRALVLTASCGGKVLDGTRVSVRCSLARRKG